MSEFLQPGSVDEVLDAKTAHPEYLVIAGGTDVFVASKDREAPPGIIDLFGVKGLCEIEASGEGGLRVGGATTFATVLADARIADEFSVLHAACREVGASQIQSRGTIGGNMVTSSPVGDSLPPLLALDAEVELASTRGTRRVP